MKFINKPLEFWDDMRPADSAPNTNDLYMIANNQLSKGSPINIEIERLKLSNNSLKEYQLEKIKKLVKIAWENVPFYKLKYINSGITDEDIENFDWETYKKLPHITKDELIKAYPKESINQNIPEDNIYTTSSSGSSGKTIMIAVDANALITDTWQGIRQMIIQTSGKYNKYYRIANINVVPWWIPEINNHYIQDFISSLINTDKQMEILSKIKPDIIYAYPSNMLALSQKNNETLKANLKLIITHSEHSTPSEREGLERKFGVPVLDEYSSEELTRIAIQFPNKNYYLCEDTARIDLLDDESGRFVETGTGLLIGTNLLNKAMPFIKYIQGDLVTIDCSDENDNSCKWRKIKNIHGRMNGNFLLENGGSVASGTLLDMVCRWMYDLDLKIEEYEVIQKTKTDIDINIVSSYLNDNSKKLESAKEYFIKMFSILLGKGLSYN